MLPTTPARATHDYQRNGTCDLFAALEIATGKVITDIRPRHTSADFVAFLNKVNRNVPADLDVHVILDNLATHKTPTVQRWLLRHRRFHFHFTPTYGSWMNLVERWFSALTTKKLQRSAHRNVKELAADIQAWADHWNDNPTPFVWHKTAEQILERLAGYCADINHEPHLDRHNFTTLQPSGTLADRVVGLQQAGSALQCVTDLSEPLRHRKVLRSHRVEPQVVDLLLNLLDRRRGTGQRSM